MKTCVLWIILLMITSFFLASCTGAEIDSVNVTEQDRDKSSQSSSVKEMSTLAPSQDLNAIIEKSETPRSNQTPNISAKTLVATEQAQTAPMIDILQVEDALHTLGYAETGFIDGIFDQQTALAIKHLQWLNGRPITGELTIDQYEDLMKGNLSGPTGKPPFPAKSLSLYTAGYMADGFLTGRLVDLGYLDDSATSFNPFTFDDATDEAVRAFQDNNDLPSNGVVDYKVWQALFHPAARNAGGGSLIDLPDPAEDWTTSFYPILQDPVDLVYDGQSIWVLHSGGVDAFENLLLRVDPSTGLLDQPAPVMVGDFDKPDNEIAEMVYDGVSIWLLLPHSFDSPELINFIPETAEIFYRSKFADCTDGGCFPAYALGFDGEQVWATVNDRAWAINRSDGKGLYNKQIGWLAHGEMAFDGVCLWMGSEVGLSSFHAGGLNHCPAEKSAYAMPSGQVVFDGQRVWAADTAGDDLNWLDVETSVIGGPIPVGDSPGALVFDGEILWVCNTGDNTIQGIDVESGSVGKPIPTGTHPVAVTYDGERLWVANAGDQTLQAIEIADYQIEIIEVTQTATPSQTLTQTPTFAPTPPMLMRSLSLQDPPIMGDDVTFLQTQLMVLGYNIGFIDGVFGAMTDAAVRQFQINNDLVVDGIVGPITWEALFSSSARGP